MMGNSYKGWRHSSMKDDDAERASNSQRLSCSSVWGEDIFSRKFAGENGGAVRKIVRIGLLPYIGRAALPVNGTDRGTDSIIGGAGYILPKIGVPQNGLQEYFIGTERMSKARENFWFTAYQIQTEIMRDTYPITAFAKLPICTAAVACGFL